MSEIIFTPFSSDPSMRLWERFSLPLFSKELIEQSNRRRTFVIRTVYAGLFYCFMVWMLWNQLGGWDANRLEMLGRGREQFQLLVGMQFFAIYAFLPGLTCGVLAGEKERDTLATLLLTKLGPWTILLEKLLSRLMPLALLLLLSLPLLAVAYSLGGVEPLMLVAAAWILALTAIQVGALSLFCSAWFRTTAGAFVGTYVLGFCLLVLPAIFAQMGIPPFRLLSAITARIMLNQQYSPPYSETLLIGFGPYVFDVGPVRNVPPVDAGFWRQVFFLLVLFFQTSGLWGSAILFLIGARVALWQRAFVQPKRRLLKLFHWLDRQFHRLNQNSVTKGIVLINESVTLPDDEPITWRETKKKALGTTRYLIRLLMAIMPPLLFFLLLIDPRMDQNSMPGLVPYILLWLGMALAVTVQSSGLIAGEKSRQTLDVLLSTPLTTEEIIRQKMAGVRKLIGVLCIPLLTVVIFDVWWEYHVMSHQSFFERLGPAFLSLTSKLATLIVYPSVIAWMGFHFGLRLRNQGQALLATSGVIVALCVVPFLLFGIFQSGTSPADRIPPPFGWATFCPVIYIIEPMQRELWQNWRNGQQILEDKRWRYELVLFAVHFGFYIFVWQFLRRWAYRDFARLVHRNDLQGGEADEFPAAPVPVAEALSS